MGLKFENNGRWKDGRRIYRELAFEKYGLEKKCNRCPKTTNLHVHHIDKNTLNNSKENLEVLCGTCHQNHHRKGIKLSEETKKKITENSGGWTHSEESKIKMRASSKIRFSKPYPEETKLKISASLLGNKHSEQAKQKMREAALKSWAKRKAV